MTSAPRSRLMVGAALAAGAVWIPVLVLWGDAPFTITFDDAWYYFEIARNIVAGHGSTFDTLSETNGYHPLWMGISAIPYALGLDGLAAVRALLVIQLACWTGALVLVARVVCRAGSRRPTDAPPPTDALRAGRDPMVLAAVVLFLVGANPFVVKTVVNGLESGVVVVVQAAILSLLFARRGRALVGSRSQRLGLGVLLALAFLARTDAAILIACIGLWSIAEIRHADVDPRAAIGRLTEVFAPPALVVAAYLLSNQILFGDPRQISGEVKRLPVTSGRALVLVGVGSLALVVGWRALRRLRLDVTDRARLPRTATFFARTGWFAAFCILIVGYYTVLSVQQWLWYFAPLALYVTFLAPLVASDLFDGAAIEASDDRAARRAQLIVQVVLLGTLAFGFLYELGQFLDPNQRSIQLADRHAGEWMSDHLPTDAVVASWDAGVLGYFTEQPVINLDGVVNSFDWLDAQRAGETDRFLRDEGITHLANHAVEVDGEDPNIAHNVTGLLGPDAADGVRQVKRFEFIYSGRIEGSSTSGKRPFATFVYEIPPES